MRHVKSAGLAVVGLALIVVTTDAKGTKSLQELIDALAARVTALENQSPCSCTTAPTWDSGWVLAPGGPEGQFSMPHPLGNQIVDAHIYSQVRQPGAAAFNAPGTVYADDSQVTVGSGFSSDLEIRVMVWTF